MSKFCFLIWVFVLKILQKNRKQQLRDYHTSFICISSLRNKKSNCNTDWITKVHDRARTDVSIGLAVLLLIMHTPNVTCVNAKSINKLHLLILKTRITIISCKDKTSRNFTDCRMRHNSYVFRATNLWPLSFYEVFWFQLWLTMLITTT